MAKVKSSRAGGKSKSKKKAKKKSSRSGLTAADRKLLAAARAELKKKPAKKKHKAKKHAKTSRKGAKSNGKKLARFNRLAKKIGKKAAHAQVYGRGAKAKGKSKHKAHHTSRRRHYASVKSSDFMAVLAQVQAANFSTGRPATPKERAQARQAIELAREAERASGFSPSTEQRLRAQVEDRIRAAKLDAARKILAVEDAARRREEAERLRAEAKARLEAKARAL